MEYTYIHNHQSQFLEWFGSPELNDHGLPIRKLGNLGTLDRGVSKVRPRNRADLYEGDYPFIQTGDITKADRYIFSHSQTYSETGLKQSKLWPSGTLCITIAANIAETAILTYDCCFPDSVVGFIPSEKINLTYIQYWFKSLQQILERQAPQTAQKNINLQILSQLDVMLPPKFEQERFSILVEQADKSKFDGFKSQFIEWFGDVEYIPLKNVCLRIGEYGSNTPATDYDGSVRYLRITDINDDGSLGNEIVSPSTIEEKYYLQTNDFVFARTGNTVGKTYLHTSGKMIYAGYLIRYKLDETCVLPKFLLAYTHTSLFWDWVSKMKKVGAQPNISAQQYNELPIPRAEIASQQRFVSIAEQADKSKYYEINET